MLKIIEFNACKNTLFINNDEKITEYNWYQLRHELILEKENFERTLIGFGSTNILDLEKRSSWTHKSKFHLNLPIEVLTFFNQNNIIYEKNPLNTIDENNVLYEKTNYFSLLKYETGDFFLNHRDTKLTNSAVFDSHHEYTCLIFCPYGESNDILEGGEIIFKHPNALYEIKFDSSVETKKNRFVMIIFSIDMYHEVLPIISGTRWLFKKPLFVQKTTILAEEVSDNMSQRSYISYGAPSYGDESYGDES